MEKNRKAEIRERTILLNCDKMVEARSKSSIKSFYSILLYSESESANNVTWLRPLSTYVTDIQLPLPLDLNIPTSQMYHMTHKYLDIAV